MNIEDELRGALDVSAPPPTTTLDVVMKRGRRRVFAHRAGAMLGVAVVVVGIGIGAATLNQAAPPPRQADRPDAGPATVQHALTWPRVDTPPQKPYGTWSPASTAPPPAGRPVLPMPRCSIGQPKWAMKVYLGSVQLDDGFVQKWIGTVREQLPEVRVSELSPRSDKSAFLEYAVDLTDSGGTGSVRLVAGRFAGTPLEYADDNLWTSGDCDPPYRTTLPDGTIVQLHSVRAAEPFQTLLQVMEVFRPDGLMLRLELANYGSKDLRPAAQEGYWERIGPGRVNLPLTEEQFSRLGPAIAGVA
ncbi:hypothetical protein SAMN04488074_106264 [Lentzea albidocapillata subsp. violacea]|uniref:Uncharacterized protein n=1 Tax=Lentzea albidocapillata subsp. violacea TaxID=128104 RepID=A0A1G9DGT0_9PSEU|nr:hypothetical protein [Lentzea albidocapillata]SDK63097.1 hypothetical protein SAMN04488074_106264 [Lentzea albidocapillata subsp. violacea]